MRFYIVDSEGTVLKTDSKEKAIAELDTGECVMIDTQMDLAIYAVDEIPQLISELDADAGMNDDEV